MTWRWLIVLWASCATITEAAHYDVYVITGQSNSLGTSGGGEPEITPGSHPADAATRFFWSNVSPTSRNPDDVRLYGDSEGRIVTLRMQQGDGGANSWFWGPEFGCARVLYDAGRSDVLFIKVSRGGGGNGAWVRGSGHMYAHLVESVRTATDRLSAEGHSFTIRTLLYVQGESDSSAEANISGDRLEALLENLREDLPGATAMSCVVGGIAADGGTRDVVRSRQRDLASASDDFAYFSNLDLRSSLYDSLHFDRDAKLVIGERFGRTILSMEGELPFVANSVFSNVVDAEGSVSMVFESYLPDSSAANGVVRQAQNPFTGFVEGIGSGAPVGVIVEGSSGSVVFADYRAPVATSDIAVGPYGNPAFPDSGHELTIRFVDPDHPQEAASVRGVAFRFGATNQADKVTVSFLDEQREPIHSLATVPAASSAAQGFVIRDSEASASGGIHELTLRTNGPVGELWALGSFDDQSVETVDLAFFGFSTSIATARPADANLDSVVDVSDAVALIHLLFLDVVTSPPCGESITDESTVELLDVNGSGEIDVSDAIYLLQFLFQGGREPTLGTSCAAVRGCPPSC